MPSSLLESNLPERVHRSLCEALPDASTSWIDVTEDNQPVLLLHANQVLAAFAFGLTDESYQALYTGFKKHFSSNGQRWASLDVSFVYCLPSTVRPTEAFCSQVESDVYFCRKFIVSVGDDISSSLLRLPFLPLAPLTGSPLRPPSAQTLLNRSNVSAELSRYLVVQNARSAQSILADCVANKFGDVEPIANLKISPEQRHDRAQSPVNLESLTIENFRAYRKSKTFTFGAAITVLYGPNGFGKTSFFDALDFVVTGGIGRLPSASNDQALIKAARHLDGRSEPSTVTLRFKRGEGSHTVVRDLSDPKHASLDSKKGVTRKEVLAMLTGGDSSSADRVENLVSLFRATHLFSQERQELTQDFQQKSELSSDLVSRMLAFEDYVSGIKKTNEVQALIKSVVERCDKEIARLDSVTEKERAELSRLDELAAITSSSAGVETELSNLKENIAAIGIDVANAPIDISTLRGWRAAIEARLAELSTQSVKLSTAMGDLLQVSTLTSELDLVDSRLSQHAALIASVDSECMMANEALQAASLELLQSRGTLTTSQRRLDSLTWMKALRPEYEEFIKARNELSTKAQLTIQEDARLRHSEQMSTLARQATEIAQGELARQIASESARLQSLQSLSRKIPVVADVNGRLNEIVSTELECIESNKSIRGELEGETETLRSIQLEVARLENEVTVREADSSELKLLVAQLRSHVEDGICLLCGVDHGSRDALLNKIDIKLEQEGQIAETRNRLSGKQNEASKATEKVAVLRQRLSNGTAQQVALQAERLQLERVVAEFSHEAALMGVPSEDLAASKEKIESSARDVELGLLGLKERHNEAELASDAAIRANEAAKAAVKNNAEIAKESAESLGSVNESIDGLVNDPRRVDAGVKFNIDTESLQFEIDSVDRDLQIANAVVSEKQLLVDRCSTYFARKSQDLSVAKKALEEDQRRRAALTSNISRMQGLLSQLELSAGSSDETVAKLIDVNSQSFADLSMLRDRTANLEVAFDAATTAAALESLRANLREHEASIDSHRKDRAIHEAWAKYFEEIAKLLGAQQVAATEEFTQQYGPRTAVIQRRLRPVYGFGDIDVSSKGGSISVRVARNGEALRPIDYFSQSQIQTLVLGLFLTACSSQTWSAFSSLMMDDPVTHFDDLNTYALLDLIAGLLQSPEVGRQFVVSTCDEKLFQLARQKFRHLNEGAKFYRFSAIGAEGPLVSEIPA